MPTLRLPRLRTSHMNGVWIRGGGRSATVPRPCIGSWPSRGRTLNTSATQSASSAPPDGTNAYMESSTTLIPSKTSYTVMLPFGEGRAPQVHGGSITVPIRLDHLQPRLGELRHLVVDGVVVGGEVHHARLLEH